MVTLHISMRIAQTEIASMAVLLVGRVTHVLACLSVVLCDIVIAVRVTVVLIWVTSALWHMAAKHLSPRVIRIFAQAAKRRREENKVLIRCTICQDPMGARTGVACSAVSLQGGFPCGGGRHPGHV